MRKIKFRGNYVGSLLSRVYGDYVHKGDAEYIFDGVMTLQCTDIAQLIGIDANGREVYEGDTVIRIAGDEDFNPEKTFPMAAAFDDYAAIRDEEIVLVVKDNGRTDKDTGGRTA